jgi:hypothetical protein
MIRFLVIFGVPIGIALQGIIEEKSRALSNVCQYGPIVILAIYGLACQAAAKFSKHPENLRGQSPMMSLLFLGFALTTCFSLFASGLDLRPGGVRDTMIVAVTYYALSAPFCWKPGHYHLFCWVHCVSFVVLSFVRSGSPADLNVIEGDSPWEHHTLGFVLPMCFFYAYLAKDLPLMAFSGCLTILAMKRVAIIAMVISLAASFLTPSAKPRALICLVLGIVLFLGSHYLDLIIEFLQNVVPEIKDFRDLFSGRGPLVKTVRETAYAEAGWVNVLFGNGPGFASKLAVEVLSTELKHIHNDYIRIFLDYGIVGSLFWLAMLARLASMSKLGYCLALYQMTVFSTDNTFVYYPHLVTLYLFAKLHDVPAKARAGAKLPTTNFGAVPRPA